MRASHTLALFAAATLPLLVGCQNKEQSFGAGGAAVGAVACGVIGNALFHTALGTLGSAGVCGAAGYFIGSSIGRQMDERDRALALAATQRALATPVHVSPGQTDQVVHPRVRTVAWTSDHDTGVRGSATVVAVQPKANGGECRTVREVAYIKGEEQTQESKYCRGGDGEWVAA